MIRITNLFGPKYGSYCHGRITPLRALATPLGQKNASPTEAGAAGKFAADEREWRVAAKAGLLAARRGG